MNISHSVLGTAARLTVILPLLLAGCAEERAGQPPQQPDGAAEQQYDVTGRVVALARDNKAVTLDHEDIPGLMKGMEMEFAADDPAILEGLEPGDQVHGRLAVRNGSYVITELHKR